jgi:hypothetical protein
MSKKHFVALANAVREHNRVAVNRLANNDHSMTVFAPDQIEALADFCKSQDGQFNRERWLGYIAGSNGPNGGTR